MNKYMCTVANFEDPFSKSWLRDSNAKKPTMDHCTVNSRKSRTLFINYDFRWLMVAEIY